MALSARKPRVHEGDRRRANAGANRSLCLAGAASGLHRSLEFGHLAAITLTGLFLLRRLGARSAVQTVAAGSAYPSYRCRMLRGKKLVAAAPARQASPQVPKLTIQAVNCDVPPN
jgi:hypothetical protein